MKVADFAGFSSGTVDFLRALVRHNDKRWFDQHRHEYDAEVMTPARAFVLAMGKALGKISAGVQADPRVNGSIFRINRDTRFSADKSPYKTHLGVFFWEGTRPRMECSGFYFHLEPPTVMLGVGLYRFPKELLGSYREAVADRKRGAALARAIEAVRAKGPYELGGEHYQKVPRGFAADHPRAALLRHQGLYLGVETPIPEELYGPELIAWCSARYRHMAPLHRWLIRL